MTRARAGCDIIVAMPGADAATLIERLFEHAGVRIGGPEPWDVAVHDRRFYERVLAHGSLGLGDSYVEGWWDCDRLDEMINRIIRANIEREVRGRLRAILAVARARLRDRYVAGRPREVTAHYGLGNEFFAHLLGPTMSYSCAYWRRAQTLSDAQQHKHELVCRKLGIDDHHRVLDLGCGWGGLVRHLADTRRCRAVGVNVASAQIEWARQAIAGTPEAARVEYVLADWRAPEVAALGKFDRITSVGMLEHVGRRNYRRLFELVRRLVREDGLFLLHTIGTSVSTDVTDPWIEQRIFPGSVLASTVDVARAAEGLFIIEDWHNFAADYDRTLLAWNDNLERHGRDSGLAARDPRFYRTFRYYLLTFAGCFRARGTIQLWQVVLSPRGVPGGYLSIR